MPKSPPIHQQETLFSMWELMRKQDDYGDSGAVVKRGKESEPRPSPVFYADYVRWVKEDTERLKGDVTGWRRELIEGRLQRNKWCLEILEKAKAR